MPASAAVHEIEYYRLFLAADEEHAIEEWWLRYSQVWDAGLLDLCRQMMAGVRSYTLHLSPRSQAIVLRSRGLLEMLLADYVRAEADYRRGLAIFQQVGDDLNSARTLNDLGTLQQALGRLEEARGSYSTALENLKRSHSDGPELPMIHNNLGSIQVFLGDLALGISHLEQAREAYRAAGVTQGVARVQINLGQLYRRHGQMELAEKALMEAYTILQESADRRMQVEALNSLGVLHRYWGRLEDASRFYAESLELAHSLGDLSGQSQALGNLGTVHQLKGDYDAAGRIYRQALSLYEEMDDIRGQAQMWGNLGHIHSFDDQEEEAATCYVRSLTLYRQSADQSGIGAGLVNLAGSYRNQGRFEEAIPFYHEAIALGRQQQDRRLEDTALGAMGTLHMMRKNWGEAESYMRQALTLQEQRGDIHAQVESLYKLGLLANERGDYAAVLPLVEPAWEMALTNNYGRWLYNIAFLLGDTAEQTDDPGAFNYYMTGVLAALKQGDSRRYESGMALLQERIQRLTIAGRKDEAREFIAYLIDYCQKHPWSESAGPAVENLTKMAHTVSLH